MLTSCEEIRTLLADFVGARLGPDQSRRVEQHRQTCPDCGEILEDLESMKQQIRAGGDAMFEAHPEPAVLYRHAQGGSREKAPGIGRHLETCATCQLEVETWRRIGRKKLAEPARTSRVSLPWMSLAAGIGALFGLFIAWRLLSAPSLRTDLPVPPPAPPVTESARIVEAPVIHLLPGLLRSGELPVQHWSIDREEPYFNIAVPLSDPGDSSDPFRFEILDSGGQAIWKTEMTASRIREHLQSLANVVSLAVNPRQEIEAGRYQFRVVRESAPEETVLYQVDVDIDYRQSPAATKAPQ